MSNRLEIAATRRLIAAQLRRLGWKHADIAEELGVEPNVISRDLVVLSVRCDECDRDAVERCGGKNLCRACLCPDEPVTLEDVVDSASAALNTERGF